MTMMSPTDYDEFARRYDAGRASVVATTLVADLETPVSAYLKLAANRAGNMFLLESVEGGAQRGRYSMIGLDPDLVWRSTGEGAEINRRALIEPDAFVPCPGKPLEALRALLAESRIDMPPGLPPMSAGVFGYLGYDMVRQMERLPPAKPDPIGVPDALLVRPTVMVVFDAVRDEMTMVTPVRPAAGVGARAAYESAQARLDAVVAALEAPLDHKPPEVRSGAARRPGRLQHQRSRISSDGRQGEGVHPRRRHLPGRAVAALHQPLRPARLLALPRAAARQPVALPLLSSISAASRSSCSSPEILVRVRDGKVTHPPDRRHAPARRDARARTRRSPPSCSPTPRSAPSI